MTDVEKQEVVVEFDGELNKTQVKELKDALEDTEAEVKTGDTIQVTVSVEKQPDRKLPSGRERKGGESMALARGLVEGAAQLSGLDLSFKQVYLPEQKKEMDKLQAELVETPEDEQHE